MTTNLRFFHLHGHTGFSTFDGMGYPKDFMTYADSNGLDGLAFTEHGHMNSYSYAYLDRKSLIEGIKSKDKKTGEEKTIKINDKFKFIPGVEFYFHPSFEDWNKQRNPEEDLDKVKKSVGVTVEDEEESKNADIIDPTNVRRKHHLVALAKNSVGLKNLFSLVSQSYKNGFYYKPRIDFELLKKYSEGLILSSACLGSLFYYETKLYLQNQNIDLSKTLENINGFDTSGIVNHLEPLVGRFLETVGKENFYLELQFNKILDQHLFNKVLIDLSKKTGVENIVTCDFHYAKPEWYRAREMYKLLGRLNQIDLDNIELPNTQDDLLCELYPKNAENLWNYYKSVTGEFDFYNDEYITNAINRTHDIAHQQIEKEIDFDKSPKLPLVKLPEGINSEAEYLKNLCQEGLKRKGLEENKEYLDRLEYELSVIREKNFERYFLTLYRVINLLHDHMLLGHGRGSGSGSLVVYLIGITHIDPIKNNLLFERFLDKNRNNIPDLDVDVSNRPLMLELLRKEFGETSILSISNYNTLQLKSLVKDISKLYGVSFEEVNDVTRQIDDDVTKKKMEVATGEKVNQGQQLTYDQAYEFCEAFHEFVHKYPFIGENIKLLYQQIRSVGKHAGGVIIYPGVLDNMPVIVSKGELQTPWPEGQKVQHLEPFGWVKFDLLGLETLPIIQRTVEIILEKELNRIPTFIEVRGWYEKHLYPSILDLNDQKVFEYVYHDGNFCGTFQFTKSPVQAFVKKVKPTDIDELSAVTAIFRPGPLEAEVHEQYLQLRNHPNKILYEHSIIEKVLGKTYGLMIFQEQMMELANKMGKVPLADCYKMVKAVSKKNSELIAKYQEQFVKGSIENGISQKIAEEWYSRIILFGKYSFNKCLAKGTLVDVYTKDGIFTETKKIEEIIAGEFVRSRDELTKQDIFVQVKELHSNGMKEACEFGPNDKNQFYQQSIKCTYDHKFRTLDGRMLPISEIDRQKIPLLDGRTVASVKYFIPLYLETYDLEVDHTDHQFYLHNGWLTSNSHSNSYATLSYQCAWLLTYYQKAWIAAYMEIMSKESDDQKEEAINEIRNMGYEIGNVDINTSTRHWSVLGDNLLIPSFGIVKGVGDTAVEEILNNRPYTSLDDLLWNEDGSWKPSKFNKRSLTSLIRLRALDSLQVVGYDKQFQSYKHLYNSLIENYDLFKKSKSYKTFSKLEESKEKIRQIIADTKCAEWEPIELLAAQQELTGYGDIKLIVDDELVALLTQHRIKSLDRYTKPDKYWFFIEKAELKVSKKGTTYIFLNVRDQSTVEKKIFCWVEEGFEDDGSVGNMPNHVCIAKIKSMGEDNREAFSTLLTGIQVVQKKS